MQTVKDGFSDATAKAEPETDSQADDKKPTPSKPKRGGRHKADYQTVQREAKIAADWEQARDSGVYKPDFAKGIKLTVKELDKLLDRVAKRKRPSE